ncbi:MAG: hypothetical protein H6816_01460 [Phycisphaerales bacterium]|nr:hypothetical protein [Phycisphaerales bacterium]
MSLLDWFAKRRKPLSQMTRAELRRQELLLEKDRMQLLNRVTKLAGKKQELFERGAKEKAPEVRRMFAQEFELMTSEQLMLARQLNIRSKEMMTVSRLRMLRENADRAAGAGSRLGLVSEKDILRLGKLIENDAIKTEMYQERLDEILKLGAEVDEGAAGLSESGETVMQVWDQMDRGAIADSSEAFEEADRRVRQQQAAPEA